MKYHKKYTKVKVFEHGDEYISPDFAPICPECGSENCSVWRDCGLETKGSWGHIGEIYSTREYYKEYTCRDCKCRFRIDEGRKTEVDWWAITGILVCILFFVSLIVGAVIGSMDGGS